MDVGLIAFSLLATFFAAAFTVPAGFGLATMITPIVFLWLEPHEAIAVVGIVHGSHNAWKLKVLRSSVDYDAVRRYGWAMVVGALIPRADRPTRWDLPGGCLPDLITSLRRVLSFQPKSLIPLQGPAIKGEQHIREVIEQHIDFFQKCLDDEGQVPRSVPRPAQTALWYSPHPPWPLKENESL